MDLFNIQWNRYYRWNQLRYVLLSNEIGIFQTIKENLRVYNNHQPYHNRHHMMAVALRADSLYQGSTVYPKSDEDRKILYMAASLHDLGHSAGALTDDRNIENTIHLIKRIVPEKYIDAVTRLIRITEYPFQRTPFIIDEKCLRDADLLMILEDDWSVFFKGLSRELNLPQLTLQDNVKWLKEQILYLDQSQYLLEECLTHAEFQDNE